MTYKLLFFFLIHSTFSFSMNQWNMSKSDLSCTEPINFLPHELSKVLSDNSFYSYIDTDVLDQIVWPDWSNDELTLISIILNKTKKNTNHILQYLLSLQSLSIFLDVYSTFRYNSLLCLLNSLDNK